MTWSLFSKSDNSTELAMLLDQFETTRPSVAIEQFNNLIIQALSKDVEPENVKTDDNVFAFFAAAKSLEKLLLIYEWQRARGQKGLDRHIQAVEAQLMPLYEEIVNSADFEVLHVGDSEEDRDALENETADFKIKTDADLIADSQDLLKRTKEAISKIVGGKLRGA